MTLVKGALTLLKVALKALLVVGAVALVGAAIYGVLSRKGGAATSYDTFPEVPVNPAATRAA